MRKLLTAAAVATLVAGCATQTEEAPVSPPPPSMSFFITGSPNPNGANLGGLEGADAMCQSLAAAAGAGNRTWRAYLSAEATDTTSPVNARDRIGQGPWYNANGVMVASNLAQLHDAAGNALSKENSLTETGAVVNGRGDEPNMHDILTGSFADGTLYIEKDIRSTTCSNWTAGDTEGVVARVGHHDRQGGGPDPTSWNSSHNTRGCALETLRATGGDGRFMCFAAD